jgi:hypothetical protein
MFEDLFGEIVNIFKEDEQNLPEVKQEGEADTWDTGQEQVFWKNIPEQGSLWKN